MTGCVMEKCMKKREGACCRLNVFCYPQFTSRSFGLLERAARDILPAPAAGEYYRLSPSVEPHALRVSHCVSHSFSLAGNDSAV